MEPLGACPAHTPPQGKSPGPGPREKGCGGTVCHILLALAALTVQKLDTGPSSVQRSLWVVAQHWEGLGSALGWAGVGSALRKQSHG